MSDDLPASKRCSSCKEIKTLDSFAKDKKKADGCKSYCKACAATYQRQRRAKNPEEHRRAAEAWRKANPEKVRQMSQVYYEAQGDKIRQAKRERYAANPEKYREASRKWRREHPEKSRQQWQNWLAANPEKALQARQAYLEANGERIREARRKQYAQNPEKIRAQVARYRRTNPEKVKASKHKWYLANRHPRTETQRERHREWMRAAYHVNPHRWPRNKERRRAYSREYRQKNLEHLKEYLRNWQKTHPEHNRLRGQKRRAKLKGNGGVFLLEEYLAMQIAQAGICAYCGDQHEPDKLSIDHIIPIDQGGRHEAANICLACKPCNSSKGPRTPEEWVDRWYHHRDK